MSRIKGIRKWDIVIPIVDRPRHSEGGFYTDFRIADEVDAPIFERAVEQAEKIVGHYVDKYLTDVHDKNHHHLVYNKNAQIYSAQQPELRVKTKMSKYV